MPSGLLALRLRRGPMIALSREALGTGHCIKSSKQKNNLTLRLISNQT